MPVRSTKAVEAMECCGRSGRSRRERDEELPDALPLLGDQADVHRPAVALGHGFEDAMDPHGLRAVDGLRMCGQNRVSAYVSCKERRALVAALKTLYRAPTEAAAKDALDAFKAGPWGEKYPAVERSWRAAWTHEAPLLAFSHPIRRALCTTCVIESLTSMVRRAVRMQALPRRPGSDQADLLGATPPEARVASASSVSALGAPGVRGPLRRALRGRHVVTARRDIPRLSTGARASEGPVPVDIAQRPLATPALERPSRAQTRNVLH